MANDPEGPQHAAKVTEGDHPVTFRSLLALREFRAIYASQVISVLGDFLTRAAVTVLVYQQTHSVLLSAFSFAVVYLPNILVGPLLATLGDRYPHRRVMIASDLFRMALTALLLIPGLPTALILLVVLVASLGTPAGQAARSALYPLAVGRDRLTLALVTSNSTVQMAQVVGYLTGAALAVGLGPRVALGVDVATFAASVLLVAAGVQTRPGAISPERRRHLLTETAEGFRLVFGHPVLRPIAVVVLTTVAFSVVPEGLAASWAAEATPKGIPQGIEQGLIMAAAPLGFVAGGLLFSHLVPVERRWRLLPILAVLVPLSLVPVLPGPQGTTVAVLTALCGMAAGAALPALNAAFVLVLPLSHRARAFGVMSSGVQASQFLAVLVTGVLADHVRIPLVVASWSAVGAVAVALIGLRWPSRERFAAAEREAAAEQATAPVPQQPSRPAGQAEPAT
ncbi:MFS transporter [Actinoplanes sp. SE50]|uniref:MFS transporter n=1 Tax=unclassified Actinoplanes TaxID=2626549 RepID=UPI00023ED390|nr:MULTISPECIES: MFS transporter [unclassified Actinoplanes]AEV82212.1 yuxJ-like uncharacterized MFS-type transporter [Actinoplanes sp. SE50/110]ATO80611.1 MFS transporter [Actinoplanes sp. SE50]SLL98017.1 MFS transporter [Actinoplanes sp. SE50/110]